MNWRLHFVRLRFVSAIAMLYVLSIGGIAYIVWPPQSPPVLAGDKPDVVIEKPKISLSKLASEQTIKLVTGKPTRIVVPSAQIDLPIIEGRYNPKDGSWTLSDDKAQYAMITMMPNNVAGNTLIYAHATSEVFGRLATSPIPKNAVAKLYTDKGQVFTYKFESAAHLQPNDTSIFEYKGKPILTLQTCTGVWSEWRSLYKFRFSEVES